MNEATHSVRLGRRGFSGAVDQPADRTPRRRRILTSGAILTGVLVIISIGEITWLILR